MKAEQLRKKYLDFFKKKGHTIIPSASLVPEQDPTVLFTTAGMHPLVPFLMGEDHPSGKRLVNVQKSMRTDDIDEVGDPWHNTFFEMMGNWSLGDYWKKEAIEWSFEFLTKELNLDPEKIHVTVFGGDKDIPGVAEDKESIEIWKSLGIDEKRIFKLGKEDNWWGPVGSTGPCGPDTEMFYDTGQPTHGEKCQPGETCGKYAEIWNNVFMEFNKTPEGKYEPLKQKNVDTGMGLERTLAILNKKESVYETELFSEAIKTLEAIRKSGEVYSKAPAPYRIITDHLKAAIFLVSDGVRPSNKERGYVLRRLIRRALVHSRKLGLEGDEWLSNCLPVLIRPYLNYYPNLKELTPEINEIITQEVDKFRKTIDEGIKALKKIFSRAIRGIDPENLPPGMKMENNVIRVDGNEVFKIYETYGLTPEISQEIMTSWGLAFDKQTMEECYQALQKHQEVSRAGLKKKFAGGLGDHSDITVRGHTATHLLHQALRDVLGNQVHQIGSNITPERIRFDFSHGEKLSEEQVKKVEEIVNSKIKDDLKVNKNLMNAEDADKLGAIGLFKDKYAEKVSIYKIGDYSVEYCGGPHVKHTSEVGKFKIIKEKALGSGQRRIRAILD